MFFSSHRVQKFIALEQDHDEISEEKQESRPLSVAPPAVNMSDRAVVNTLINPMV